MIETVDLCADLSDMSVLTKAVVQVRQGPLQQGKVGGQGGRSGFGRDTSHKSESWDVSRHNPSSHAELELPFAGHVSAMSNSTDPNPGPSQMYGCVLPAKPFPLFLGTLIL